MSQKDLNEQLEGQAQEPLMQEEEAEQLEKVQEQYREQPWRFVNLTVFVLASLANSLPTHTFTPINSIVGRVYNVDKLLIAMNTLVFPISHPLLAFLANWILDKYGLRIGCNIGAVLIILGVWARTLIATSFAFPLIGSLLAAIGNIFIINSPSKMANVWFRPSKVAIITTIGVMSSLASNALGVVFPTLFVNSSSTEDDVEKLLLVEAGIVSFPLLLMLLLLRKKPVHPPSYAATVESRENYKEDLKNLFTNKNYLWLLLVCSTSYGTLVAFTTVIEYLVLPFKYAEASKTASDMLLSAIASGFIGSFIFVTVLKKTRKYKKILMVAILGCIIEIICVSFALDTNTFWVVLVIVGFAGVFFIPQVPIILEFGCEIAFPIGQASSSGFLLAGGQLLGFLSATGFIQILDGQHIWKVFLVIGFFVLFLGIGAVGLCFVKEDLRRTKYELQTSKEVKSHSGTVIKAE